MRLFCVKLHPEEILNSSIRAICTLKTHLEALQNFNAMLLNCAFYPETNKITFINLNQLDIQNEKHHGILHTDGAAAALAHGHYFYCSLSFTKKP